MTLRVKRPRADMFTDDVEPPVTSEISNAPPAPALKGDTTTLDLTPAERALARRTAEARATVPDLELELTIDAEAAIALARARGCSHTAVLARACAVALRDCPRANAAYRDGRHELYSRVNLGVTVQTVDGQQTATVLDADTLSLTQLDAEIARITARAASGELTPPEMAGATFTLTDLGELGVDRWSLPVGPTAAGLLVAGAIRPAPLVRDGELVAGHVQSLTLVCDHRILYGSLAADFLTRVAKHLEQGLE
jgi:pyruvate dehydrogenase E2 component (dihydrolipoamide acetyltransferase)